MIDYWLSPTDVADTYRGIGRIDDAIAVLRADFVRQPAVRAYRSLLDFAATIDRADTERAWALDHARELASGPGAGSVLVPLTERGRYRGRVGGCRPLWARLGMAGTRDARREARPIAAADLYRPQLENDLQRPNTRLYPGIAATLATMAQLYERGGHSADFALYLAKVRQDYDRRLADEDSAARRRGSERPHSLGQRVRSTGCVDLACRGNRHRRPHSCWRTPAALTPASAPRALSPPSTLS